MKDLTNTVKILSEPMNKVLNPPAEKVGNTLAAIWSITFGWIDNFDEKLKIKRQKELQEFTKILEQEVAKIPDNNRIEPKLSIAGPTLEASKFYIEEESLRKMFAKLLANSMNKDIAHLVQASFVEIIKQMSPLDAQLLLFFKKHPKEPCVGFSAKMNGEARDEITNELIIPKDTFIPILPFAYWNLDQNERDVDKNLVSI